MTEEARTAAITQGMSGLAQDYILYPPEGKLEPGKPFQAHVRHLLIGGSQDELPKLLEQRWAAFTEDHERVRRWTQVR